MRKRFFMLSVLILAAISLAAQMDSTSVRPRKNSIFLEFGGNNVAQENEWLRGPLYGIHYGDNNLNAIDMFSVNYDRIVIEQHKIKAVIRIGSSIPRKNMRYYSNSALFNLMIGKKRGCFEVGMGTGVAYYYPDSRGDFLLTSVLGFRYESNNGFALRISLTPTAGLSRLSSWAGIGGYSYLGADAGISIGYSF